MSKSNQPQLAGLSQGLQQGLEGKSQQQCPFLQPSLMPQPPQAYILLVVSSKDFLQQCVPFLKSVASWLIRLGIDRFDHSFSSEGK